MTLPGISPSLEAAPVTARPCVTTLAVRLLALPHQWSPALARVNSAPHGGGEGGEGGGGGGGEGVPFDNKMKNINKCWDAFFLNNVLNIKHQ